MSDERDPDEHQRFVDRKRRARMERFDTLTPEMRELANEYGMPVINAFMDLGVTKPRHIRHLVETVLDEFSPTRGSYASQGIRTPPIDHSRSA